MIHVAGITPFTTIDYPGLLSAVLFCQGCPWRCGYCHNAHLQPHSEGSHPWDQVLVFLRSRLGLLDAVVFSGGEPTLQPGLGDAIQEVKRLGFKIGLHTAGVLPDRFISLLPHLDWVGMDIKAPFGSYEKVTRVVGSGAKAKESALALIRSGVHYEFRTTVHPHLLTVEDLDALTVELSQMGGQHFVLQPFRATGCVEPHLLSSTPFPLFPEALLEKIRLRFRTFSVRE